MLALSSPMFSSNGWLFDDSMSHPEHQDNQQHFSSIPKELLSPPHQSHLQFYFSQQTSNPLQQLDRFDPVTPSPTAVSGDPTVVKKLNHNASERDRRRKINDLYSSLRSLLPSTDHSKKLSIPATVSRVLKYIPELQQQVQKLAKAKEELLLRIPSKNEAGEGSPLIRLSGTGRHDRMNGSPEVAGKRCVSANWLSDREVAVQISVQKETESQLSTILLNLERDGFPVIDASTFESCGGNRLFYTLHLQAERTSNASDCDKLREKIVSLCERSYHFFRRNGAFVN